MPLTGTGNQIGSATEFGQNIRYPRAMASDGTVLYLFGASRGYSLNPSTGEATPIGNVSNFDAGENKVRAATFHNGQVLIFGRENEKIQIFNTTTGVLTDWHTNIIDYVDSTITDRPDLWGIASLNGVLYGADRQTDALYTISSSGVLTRVGTATQFGISAGRVQGFTAYRGKLIGADIGLDKTFEIDPTTGVATIIGGTNALPDGSPEALCEHDGKLYMAGSAADALFRLYDVLWNETIADIEVDEGGNGRLDLSTVSQDAASFEFAPSHTARSWLTLSGTELVITNAPAVTADTDFSPEVRALRDSAHEDKTLTVTVRDTTPPPVTPPTFTAPSTNYEVNERADDSIDSTEFFTGHTSLTFRSGYSAPSWLTILGLNVVITDAPDVLEDTDFTVPLTATNSNSSVNGSITISVQQIDPAPVFGTPNRFDIDEGSSPVFDLSGDLQHTESLAYQSGYSAPSWLTISGLTLVITNAEQVSQDTDFDVLLAAESTKTAATADRTVTIRVRDVAIPPPPITVPSAPLNLQVTGKGTDFIDLEWEDPADNGGAAIQGHEVSVEEGATPGDTWIPTGSTNTTHRVSSLKPNTQYTIQVRSRNSEGASHPSNSVTERTDAQIARVRAVPPHPTDPLQVNVELTPTTAKISWKTPTNGASLTGYEMSYAEGASPGTTWIATGSTRTQFFVKGLKRGTQYTFGVRGVNDNGEGQASSPVTERTPIASLHNALFFKECVNYFDAGGRVSVHGDPTQLVRAVADNNYKTFAREKDLVLNIAVGGNPTRVDAIFVKGIDIEGHSAEPTGGIGSGYSNRVMPATVQNWEGTDVSTIVNDFSHDLYLLDQHFTATSVRMTFTGANAKIVEVMCLEFGIEIDANSDFTEINPDFVDRAGVIHSDPGGGIVYDSPIGEERDKWQIDYTVKVVPGKTILQTPEEFLYWRSENRNHVHAQEPSRFPWRIFPSVFMRKSVPVRYRTDDKTGGEFINFRVAEQ